MQWLIDIIYEKMLAAGFATQIFVFGQIDLVKAWVMAWNFLQTSYVHRGDPIGHDFDKTDFITDYTWRTLDLSSLVPAGAKAVLLLNDIKDNTIGMTFFMRRNGQSYAKNNSGITTQVANHYFRGSVVVALDENRIIEYRASAGTWDFIFLTVRGWWL